MNLIEIWNTPSTTMPEMKVLFISFVGSPSAPVRVYYDAAATVGDILKEVSSPPGHKLGAGADWRGTLDEDKQVAAHFRSVDVAWISGWSQTPAWMQHNALQDAHCAARADVLRGLMHLLP